MLSKKVLIVDDNVANQSLVSRILKSWGCRPEVSADGVSAMGMLHQARQSGDPFQIALLDMTLPVAGGEELAKRIAADPELRDTALVLMTTFSRQQSDSERLRALGFVNHVTKPIWEHTLRDTLVAIGAPGNLAVSAANPLAWFPAPSLANRRARILLVEDNATSQQVALAILERLGYGAELVANGAQAIRALQEADYDLVLMDCEMPDIDGYEATRRIRELHAKTRNPLIPIIAVTADANSGDLEKCLRVGMNDYVAKPVDPRRLAGILEKWLNKSVDGAMNTPPPGSPLVSDEAIFNQKELLARLMGDDALARHVVAGFLDDFPSQLLGLKERLEAGDSDRVRIQAHSLKGAAATVSAEHLRAACCEMQVAAQSGDMAAALSILPSLDTEFKRLQASLKQSEWM